MRHRVYGKHLGRDKNQRAALFKNLVGALFLHGSIETTESKAKSIKGLVDKIIHKAKSKNTQRLVSQFLTDQEIQEKLFKEIVPAVSGRTSGYTSVIKLGKRLGDNAMKVRMSLLLEESRVKSLGSSTKQKAQVKSKKTEKPINKSRVTKTLAKGGKKS